ncbi:MAG: type I methionyl aminopeptidase [Candidatus Latescibacterota bacterium]|nr:type I methionyl aminopeptidase [Candidatus Latescibacterota bacterium]
MAVFQPAKTGLGALIPRYTRSEIDRIRLAGAIVHQVQRALEAEIGPGVTTAELDALAESTIRRAGGEPAFKGYHGFPASICTSINAEAVHGFPRPEPLSEGDLLCIDVGIRLEGWYGDGAFTLSVGEPVPPVRNLMEATRTALAAAVAAAQVGNRLSDISHAVESAARDAGVHVLRDYGGHGIGRELHGEPHIPNYGGPGRGPLLEAGQVFALEPIFGLGTGEVAVDKDGWTVLTVDGSPAAHFEHTVALTEQGPEILTLPSSDSTVAEASRTAVQAR